MVYELLLVDREL